MPLSAVVTTRQTVGPLSVNHIGQLPSVTLSFNLRPGVALGDAVARVQAARARRCPTPCPRSFQGTAQAFQSSMNGLGWVLALAIVVIYIVLGILYESFIHPITILSAPALRRLRRAAHAADLPASSCRSTRSSASSCWSAS